MQIAKWGASLGAVRPHVFITNKPAFNAAPDDVLVFGEFRCEACSTMNQFICPDEEGVEEKRCQRCQKPIQAVFIEPLRAAGLMVRLSRQLQNFPKVMASEVLSDE